MNGGAVLVPHRGRNPEQGTESRPCSRRTRILVKPFRIPTPVNRVWDAAARHSYALFNVAAAAVTLVLIQVHWVAGAVAGVVFAAVSGYLGWRRSVVPRLMETIAALEWECDVQAEELKRLKAGDASAQTIAIHQIPEDGDR